MISRTTIHYDGPNCKRIAYGYKSPQYPDRPVKYTFYREGVVYGESHEEDALST